MRVWPITALCALTLGGCAGTLGVREGDGTAAQTVRQAVAALQGGKLLEAYQIAAVGAGSYPEDPQLHNLLGVTQHRLQRPDQARDSYQRALALAPREPRILNNYGTFLCDRKDYLSAEQQFLAAATLADNPSPDVAYVNAGLCAERGGRAEAALGFFESAVGHNPAQPVALYQLARAHLAQGQADTAAHYLERYLGYAPHSARSLLLAARIEARRGHAAGVSEYVAKLASGFPASAELTEARGLLAARGSAPAAAQSGLLDADWIQTRSSSNYTVELLSAVDQATLNEKLALLRGTARLAYFSLRQDGQVRFSVIAGDYSDYRAAAAALATFDRDALALRPWVRTFGDIQASLKPIEQVPIEMPLR
ncbi:MAG: tetratricopeptide repeat protein [Thiotrichales bacterium]